jgi:hypothetical protein
MSWSSKQSITLGSTRGIGNASVDESNLRGEGGPSRPRLLIPVDVSLDARPHEAQIAIVALEASLGFQEHVGPHNAIGRSVTQLLFGDFPLLSQAYEHSRRVDLRFEINQAEVEQLERSRHETRENHFPLYLHLAPTVVALQHFNSLDQKTQTMKTLEGFDVNLGLISLPVFFWSARISDLRLQIEHAAWIRDVLPGLGYDRARIVELSFPPAFPDHQSAIAQFDTARAALAQRRYDDCVAACRGLMNIWETQLGATRSKPVATVVAERWGWEDDDPRRKFFDGLWKTLGDIANAPHHPEGRRPGYLDMSEARLALYLTSLLSEYLMAQQP